MAKLGDAWRTFIKVSGREPETLEELKKTQQILNQLHVEGIDVSSLPHHEANRLMHDTFPPFHSMSRNEQMSELISLRGHANDPYFSPSSLAELQSRKMHHNQTPEGMRGDPKTHAYFSKKYERNIHKLSKAVTARARHKNEFEERMKQLTRAMHQGTNAAFFK